MIGIVDYDIGNLKSILNGLLYNEIEEARLISNPSELSQCDKIILPGVGAFREAMSRLTSSGFDQVIKEQVKKRVPLLGICLGMQLLASKSYEGGEEGGLDLIKGVVNKIEWDNAKVPHMGWNSIQHSNSPLYSGIENGADFYFVHSYHFIPEDKKVVMSTTDYGERFVSSIQSGNIYGVQFHPEKSQSDGLKVLRNFMEL